MSSLGEEDDALHARVQADESLSLVLKKKKKICASNAQLLYWMPNVFRLPSTRLFKVSYYRSPLSNPVKLWFKEDKHKYIKDKWSQKLYY